jgi:DNA transposition AAA+ family ATPase
MRYKIVEVKNVVALFSAYEALAESDGSIPRMGLVYGVTGAGKTSAITLLANRVDAVMVKASPTWTLRTMLNMVMKELSADPMRSNSDMEQFIIEKMQMDNRPLFVDEADAFTDPAVRGDRSYAILETLRSIHDISKMPVMLIGMPGIERRLACRHQLMRRFSQWVEFQPAKLDDARQIATACCEVNVEEDLLRKLLDSAQGNVGLLMVGLARMERKAKVNGLEKIGLREWGGERFNLRGDKAGKEESHEGA